jgi:hypothetical protein
MKQLAVSVAAIALLTTSCTKQSTNDVLSGTQPPKVIYATTECTVPNGDGVRCDRKTCKADQAGDCSIFMDRCTESGHNYEGDKNQGTCIRGTKSA